MAKKEAKGSADLEAENEKDTVHTGDESIDREENGINEDTAAQEPVDQTGEDEADKTTVASDGPENPGKQTVTVGNGTRFTRFKHWYGRHKKWTIPATVLLVLATSLAIPFTRYKLAGLVIERTFSVRVLDSETGKPVSKADVMAGKAKVQTNSQGYANIRLRAGDKLLAVEKNYYQKTEQKVLVPILKQKSIPEMKIKATGRQVPITLLNKISKKPIENATISAANTKASTDKDGKAVLVLPANQQEVEATLSADGYRESKSNIKVSTDESANVVALTPSGSVYFLSDRSGKLDIVKTDLDGSNRATVIAGTGKEDKKSTILLAARDWKYLALLSKRDGGEYAKLFLIDTSNDKMIVMDEGVASFTLTGWSEHRFVYTVNRPKVDYWMPNRDALKVYDADSRKLSTLDQTGGSGNSTYYAFSQIGSVYILKNEITYTKIWQGSWSVYNNFTQEYRDWVQKMRSQPAELKSIRPDGSAARTIKSYTVPKDDSPSALPLTVNLNTRVYEPQALWILVENTGQPAFIEEYESGKVSPEPSVKSDDFWEKEYATRLISPDGNKTFWGETRDGKTTLFVGNAEGKEGKEIAKLSEYNAYGWYTDQYLLVSKAGSELYVLPIDGGEALKLTDYYKPVVNFAGYGYGYGGL